MPARKLKRFLEDNQVAYSTIPHYATYTAQETAASAHVRGRDLAKTVIVKLDGQVAMAVLPATRRLDLDRLREAAGVQQAELATEQDFRDMFPDCDVGAMPPFGNLYGLKVLVDRTLTDDEHIAFNAGSHEELIQLSYADFARLVDPTVASLAWELTTSG